MEATNLTDTAVTADTIEVKFLCEGCQTAESVASELADFISLATKTLDMAIYSFHLCPGPHEIVLEALRKRADAGVAIRIAYDAGTQLSSMPGLYNDPCDLDTPDFVRSLGVPSKPIEGYHALMHDKYVVVDASTPNAQVWTGSTNWTDDSWRLEENNIIILRSPEIAHYYQEDFDDLWTDGNIAASQEMDALTVSMRYDNEPAKVNVYFSPAEGLEMDQLLADTIRGTQRVLTLASVVVTSGKVLDALQDLMKRGVQIDGMYDATQMGGVKYQWQQVPANHWKIPAWEEIISYGHLVGKNSTPYTPTSEHDYMHNKVLVADDTVVTGSYNFSRHAQSNAENMLIIESAPLAHVYRQYIYEMMQKYSAPSGDTNPPPVREPEQQAPNI